MRPLTLATTGLDQAPCSTLSPAPMARQTNSPERLFTAIRLGARGDGTRVWPSFWPLEVETSSRSPAGACVGQAPSPVRADDPVTLSQEDMCRRLRRQWMADLPVMPERVDYATQ